MLDCGCGPGAITLGLAEIVYPGVTIGIDVESKQIDEAEALAFRLGGDNLRYKVASAYELPFDSQSFDRVFCNALMEHLAQPEAALEELRRVLKPGGVIGVCSPDWNGFIISPRAREVDEALALHRKLQTRNGDDPFIGAKLGAMLSEAGYQSVSMAAHYECFDDNATVADRLASEIEEAVVDGDDAEEMARTDPTLRAEALREWGRQPVTLFAQAWVSAVARR